MSPDHLARGERLFTGHDLLVKTQDTYIKIGFEKYGIYTAFFISDKGNTI